MYLMASKIALGGREGGRQGSVRVAAGVKKLSQEKVTERGESSENKFSHTL